MILPPRPILALALLAAVLAACSGGGVQPSGVATIDDPAASATPQTSGAPAASVSPEDAMLAFAKCMREHGIDMPDPVVNADGGIMVSIGTEAGKPIDTTTMQAANEACKDLMPGPVGGGPTRMTAEQQDAMLAYAKCMREHGVAMADPEFGTGGGITIGGDGIEVDSPTFKAADDACRSIMTDSMPDVIGGEGGPSVSVGGPGSGGASTGGGPGFQAEPAQ